MRSSIRGNVTRGGANRREHRYQLYCVNFYDNSLSAIRNEFIKRIQDGKRRSVFIIDIESQIDEANEFNSLPSQANKPFNKTTEPLMIVMNCIEEIRKQHDFVTKRINEEQKFNLYDYYLANLNAQVFKERPNDKLKSKTESKRATKTKSKRGSSISNVNNMPTDIVCYGVVPREHNKIGKEQLYTKRMYIVDEPENSGIFIVIVGNLDNQFYMDLLRQNLPLSAIIHFLPEECAYDLLVPRPKRKQFLQETVANIQKSIQSLRKRIITKPIALFQQQLPVMSVCLASKYSDDIYNQLSWYLYDVETLRNWYQKFYVKPYKEADVNMDPKANLYESYLMAEMLSMQGHYMKHPLPAASPDDATIYVYLESLLSTFGKPRELLSDIEVLLLANPTPAVHTRVLDKIKVYTHAFSSTLKLTKSDRLFIEEPNKLLYNIISYGKEGPLRNIYYICLEYNILRRYITSNYIDNFINIKRYSGELEPLYLNKYAKLYLSHDSVEQRLIELIDEYPEFRVEEAYPNVKLYTFTRVLNEVVETENEATIPTRLCFRDFTLYEMDQFTKDLVTPEMYKAYQKEKELNQVFSHLNANNILTEGAPTEMTMHMKDGVTIKIDLNVFVRPNSLKAKRLNELLNQAPGQREKPSHNGNLRTDATRSTRGKTKRKRPSVSDGASLIDKESESNKNRPKENDAEPPYNVGLPSNHPMLYGYNLNDTRQTIKTKTASYYFDEGKLRLYEERWNFTHTNKTLMVSVAELRIHFASQRHNVSRVAPRINLQTKNDLMLSVTTDVEECAKAVLNYPTGLSVRCFEKHIEQLWNQQASFNDETRRIFTPYGCVLVFYNNDDMVLIMRYNGEVYKLCNYLEGNEEEEESLLDLNTLKSETSMLDGVENQQKRKPPKKKTIGKREKGGGGKREGAGNKRERTVGKSKNGEQQEKSKSAKSKSGKASMQEKVKQTLLDDVDCEMKYLHFLMTLYNLKYLHLKLTTSDGRVMHMLAAGKVYAGQPVTYTEWHDYWANESYSMRDDGVKMIWTADSLKCYHADGTVIITSTDETFESSAIDDEFDNQVTESSSHDNSEDQPIRKTMSNIYINTPTGLSTQHIEEKPKKASESSSTISASKTTGIEPNTKRMSEYLVEEEGEEVHLYDPSFITYIPQSYLIQHPIYAGISFALKFINNEMKNAYQIFGADGLNVKIYQHQIVPEVSHKVKFKVDDDEDYEESEENTENSSRADVDEQTQNLTAGNSQESPTSVTEITIIEISCNDVNLKVKNNTIELNMSIRRFGCSENVNVIRERVALKLEFSQSLSSIFRAWVKELVSFINCGCPKMQTFSFVEYLMDNCKKKGFEILPKLPPLRKYNFCASNLILDINEMTPISKRLENQFPSHETDMQKFPRFSVRKKKINRKADFPMVLSVNAYVEIPKQLATTDRIHQFTIPFERITFRKLRYRFNEAVLFHLYPHLQFMLMKTINERSWKLRLRQHKRQLFLEQQRLGLYLAMLRYKVYPNYFQFKNKFYSHVRNIDFFEFMTMKCNEKAKADMKESTDKSHKSPTAQERANDRKRRKKCLCPKYPL